MSKKLHFLSRIGSVENDKHARTKVNVPAGPGSLTRTRSTELNIRRIKGIMSATVESYQASRATRLTSSHTWGASENNHMSQKKKKNNKNNRLSFDSLCYETTYIQHFKSLPKGSIFMVTDIRSSELCRQAKRRSLPLQVVLQKRFGIGNRLFEPWLKIAEGQQINLIRSTNKLEFGKSSELIKILFTNDNSTWADKVAMDTNI